jgi:hypothetical protein
MLAGRDLEEAVMRYLGLLEAESRETGGNETGKRTKLAADGP